MLSLGEKRLRNSDCSLFTSRSYRSFVIFRSYHGMLQPGQCMTCDFGALAGSRYSLKTSRSVRESLSGNIDKPLYDSGEEGGVVGMYSESGERKGMGCP